MNTRILKRYHNFLQKCRSRVTTLDYYETHHIIPKCVGGTDDACNIIPLSPREHYIAHMLLVYVYEHNKSLQFAFLQMANKNHLKMIKWHGLSKSRTINSRSYQSIKNSFYGKISMQRKNVVNCKDQHGNKIKVTSAEFKKRSDLVFHTKGKVYCTDTRTNTKVWISREEFHSNDFYKKDITNNLIQIKNNTTNCVLEVTYHDWLTCYKNQTYEADGKIKPRRLYSMVKTFSDECIEKKKAKNTFVVYNSLLNDFQTIKNGEYDPLIHTTTTKNKVLAKDECGNSILISKHEFLKGQHVGHTKGLCKVIDKHTQQQVLISREMLNQFPDRYEGHMKNKVNVVEKTTGTRLIISKDEYDPNVYCALGNRQFLFKGLTKHTNKIKNINIYEYLKNPNLYNIIDMEKFKKISHTLETKK